MSLFEEVVQRLDVQTLSSLILEGSEDYARAGSYDDRIDDAYQTLKNHLYAAFGDEKKAGNALNVAYRACSIYQDVFFELGIRAGARLMANLLSDKE